MLIAYTGAHNTGKTTGAKKLANAIGGTYVYEGARELLNRMNWHWRNANSVEHLVFELALVEIYKANLELINIYGTDEDIIILDRLPIDIMAYTETRYLEIETSDRVANLLYNRIINECIKILPSPDLIVWCKNYDPDDWIASAVNTWIGYFLNKYYKNANVYECYSYPSTRQSMKRILKCLNAASMAENQT